MRDNGARGLVNQVESIYYSLNAPAKGGPGLRTLPSLAGVKLNPPTAHRHAVRHYYRPPRIRPVLSPALPGRGCVAGDVRTRRCQTPGSDHELPSRPVVSANGRRRSLDQQHAHHNLAVPRPT